MARDRDHLPLLVASSRLKRRPRKARGKPRGDKQSHGRQVLDQIDEVRHALKSRRDRLPEGLEPGNLFKVTGEGNLSEELLQKCGLTLVSVDEAKAILVATKDLDLSEIRRRFREYAGLVAGAKYDELGAFETISLLEPADRMGRRLSAEPLAENTTAMLDCELWHWGDKAAARERLKQLLNNLAASGGTVTDDWVGEHICLARIRIDGAALQSLLEWDIIKEIDRRPPPGLLVSDYIGLGANDLETLPPPADAIGILVLDSGVATLHPVLSQCIGDAQAFPEAFAQSAQGPEDQNGHGTAVATLAAYGNVAEAIRSRVFEPSALVFSGRILDANAEYDEEKLVESQLDAALEYFLGNYSQIRVINLSIGSRDSILTAGRYQLRLASVLDELLYRHRDREILAVVSAGNQLPISVPEAHALVEKYPQHLLSTENRIIDPASSALALTVGGLSAGLIANYQTDQRAVRLLSGGPLHPSPFTRSGPGLNGSIKPELVELAGDYALEGQMLQKPGVLSSSHAMNENLFKHFIGTSFAAPQVANSAARLLRERPDYSSNLIRALLVHSASLPDSRPRDLEGNPTSDKVLRIYGYGRPSWEIARRAGGNNPWLIHQDSIDLDTFSILEIPELPEEFITKKGTRRIAITVAYDPPTRATRGDIYLGVSIDFALYRNVTLEQLGECYRKWDRDEAGLDEDGTPLKVPGRDLIKSGQIDLLPKITQRRSGTVQHGSKLILRPQGYEAGSPLYLVIICQRKWAPVSVINQRFGVVASLFHSDETVDLDATLRANLRIQAELQVRAQLRTSAST